MTNSKRASYLPPSGESKGAPFQTYNGGKEADGTFQKIINLIPPHDLYIEPFLGNGAIFRHKKKADWSIGIDMDTSVIESWQKMPFSKRPDLINADAITWLEHFAPIASFLHYYQRPTFIYLDPPYPKDTRKNGKDLYRHEMDIKQHEKLLSVIRPLELVCSVMVSSYPNELYDEALAGWHTTTFQSQTRHGMATEKLWMNYPAPTELHDYRYLGDDYRERERIKGIICRNAAKLKRMPAAERNAFINHLKNEKLI